MEIRDFVNRLDKAANLAKKFDMTISETVKAFKLLKDSKISNEDKKLVMSAIDFKGDKEKIYTDA